LVFLVVSFPLALFILYKTLPETRKGQDILDVVEGYSSSHELQWESCISICMDVAPSTSGSLKGFITLTKKKNPWIALAHDFMHRETLTSKSGASEVQKALDEIIKMVNSIKSRPLQSCSQYCVLP
jgi:hypothetical protein